MTFTEEQFERIVTEVIRRLGLAGAEHNRSAPAAGTDLRLAERVVTMRTIETRLSRVKRVVVEPRAVVTPAVKDELKARKIELVYRETEH
jgi:hypothetical protein